MFLKAVTVHVAGTVVPHWCILEPQGWGVLAPTDKGGVGKYESGKTHVYQVRVAPLEQCLTSASSYGAQQGALAERLLPAVHACKTCTPRVAG